MASSLKIPMSPFKRTPSVAALNSPDSLMDQRGNKESLADLWSDFLEKQVAEADTSANSRRPSTASTEPKPPPS
ncbi:hypothetical protein BT63DRAFT_154155 [Microthyrium microscopicum]|uniref:Uncharacterized protein n=1 Tax=Microthyrium microscopicum TaxID=703497 RepID=A0A6A6UQJ2_9PEZI|nr:hypothetical protein BT63DRAFT_154155 [Microthyrium microscopicum]